MKQQPQASVVGGSGGRSEAEPPSLNDDSRRQEESRRKHTARPPYASRAASSPRRQEESRRKHTARPPYASCSASKPEGSRRRHAARPLYAALAAACLLALPATAAPPATDAQKVLAALAKAGAELHTLRADFEQTKVLTLLDESETSRGKVLLQVPGRLRWDYVAPQPGAMVIKDGQFARYVPQTRQVFRGAARGEADLLVGFGPGAAQLGSKYQVTLVGEETVGGRAAWVLDLKPKPAQSGLFSAIRLWVDQERSIPVQTRLTEPTGDSTTLRFEKAEINARLPATAFDLSLPKDVVEVR